MASWKRRAIALAAGIVISIAAIEVALQIAAAFAKPTRPLPVVVVKNPLSKIVVFSGDSHTYGLWVEPAECLPSAVESLTNQIAPPGIVSINLGRSSSTSWKAVDEATRAMEQYHPAALVLRIGINNSIFVRDEEARWYDALRIVRLGRILFAGRSATAATQPGQEAENNISKRRDEAGATTQAAAIDDAPFAIKRREGSVAYDASVEQGLRADIRLLADVARRRDTKLIFVSYLDPAERYRNVSKTLEQCAAEVGAVFVNTAPFGAKLIEEGRRREILFQDGHPTARGYALEARAVVSALRTAGIVAGADPGDPLAWYYNSVAPSAPAGESVELKIVYGAGKATILSILSVANAKGWAVLGRPGEGFEMENVNIPILRGDATKAAEFTNLTFTTDSEGYAHVVLPHEWRIQFPKGAAAVAFVRAKRGEIEELNYSPIIDLETAKTIDKKVTKK
ncbi:MAG: SGNH/GDSL hydrolase family protein [Planctomycetota bacterium]